MTDDNTDGWSRRSILRVTGSGALLVTAGATPVVAQEDEMRSAAKRAVAERENTDRESLEIQTDSVVTYDPLEERYYTAKVRDTANRETYGVTLDGTKTAVDKATTRARSQRAYKRQYGKLDRDLAERVTTADDDERITVDVWLNGIDRAAARQAVGFDARPDDADLKRDLSDEITSRIRNRTDALGDAMDEMPGVTVRERGISAPLVTAEATPGAIDRLQRRQDVWMVMERDGESGDSLGSASRTHGSYSERNGDYDASNYDVGVFEYTGYTEQSYVIREATFPDDSDPARDKHEHVVSMCVGGTSDTEPGIAPYADIFAAQDPNTKLEQKIDWFANNGVAAINFSFYLNANGKRKMQSTDLQWGQWVVNRYLNMVVAAGNESSTGDLIVTTPAKGFNTLSVGATSDKGTGNDLTDDETSFYSCRKNPRSEHDTPSSDYYPHEKPEVSAVGTNIDTPPYSPTSGTSFAAPHVTGLITLLEKFTDQYGGVEISLFPEVAKPIVMAAATNQGDSSYSIDDMGTGTIRAPAAERIVQNGWFVSDSFDKSNSEQTYTFSVSDGERVRVALNWFTDVTASDFSDLKNARSDLDIDLYVYDPNGNYVTGSAAYDRGWEFVEFTASQSGTYEIEVSKFDWQSSDSNRYFGLAWHRD